MRHKRSERPSRDAESGCGSRTVKVGSSFDFLKSSSVPRVTRVLVDGESFAVFEVGGDVVESTSEPFGFFHRNTRYLSRFELRIAAQTPCCLNSCTSPDNAQIHINSTNPHIGSADQKYQFPENSIQVTRNWAIANASLFHRVIVRNYACQRVEIPLDLLFAADFADLFEVRGFKRDCRGGYSEPEVSADSITFSYTGIDGARRFARLVFAPQPAVLGTERASFAFTLNPGEARGLEIRITASSDGQQTRIRPPARFAQALAQRRSEIERLNLQSTTISASDELLNSLLHRSSADLTSIICQVPEGAYAMAGIPWFAALFGRDSILSALSALPFNPELAKGTLKRLAGLQGTKVDRQRGEQPGKIVHEVRGGELAATGEVPFGRYYGSVDATPLFLWLLGRYVHTTGDLELADRLWKNAERALDWIERWGDRDGDLYVEYICEQPNGLANQGWKDSFDAISHADGTLAKPPIAVCEVQGYVYAAYVSIAEVARLLGRQELATRLDERAAMLRSKFRRDFWLERERTVALALDADKKPCRVMASNAGHCLATGLLDDDQAEALAERLMDEEMFTGWGVRTLGCSERRYNPMSYHNGSVWPHDNAIVAAGLARIPGRQCLIRIFEALLDAALHLQSGSLPELFCGFPRDCNGPVPYPVACHPQAWSAASIFMIVQAMLGIELNGLSNKLVLDSPVLPDWLDWLKIENLRIGAGEASFAVQRTTSGPAVEVLEKRGDISIEVRSDLGGTSDGVDKD